MGGAEPGAGPERSGRPVSRGAGRRRGHRDKEHTITTLTRALVASALLAAGLGCASTGEAPRPDAEITAAVKAEFAAAPEINPFTVEVDTRDGVVTLSGRVAAAEDRVEAERIARSVAGVRRVVNLLEVGDA